MTRSDPTPRVRDVVRGPAWGLLWLLVALAANVAVAFVPVDEVLRTGINLVLAAISVGLIVFVFMELDRKSAVFRLFAAAGFVWLAILFILIASDYMMRR